MIKIFCDVCESEKGVKSCVMANDTYFCEPCHTKFHDITGVEFGVINMQLKYVISYALSQIKRELGSNVVKLREVK